MENSWVLRFINGVKLVGLTMDKKRSLQVLVIKGFKIETWVLVSERNLYSREYI